MLLKRLLSRVVFCCCPDLSLSFSPSPPPPSLSLTLKHDAKLPDVDVSPPAHVDLSKGLVARVDLLLRQRHTSTAAAAAAVTITPRPRARPSVAPPRPLPFARKADSVLGVSRSLQSLRNLRSLRSLPKPAPSLPKPAQAFEQELSIGYMAINRSNVVHNVQRRYRSTYS